MPTFDTINESQLTALRELTRRGETIDVCEVVAIHWKEPTATRYYGHAPFHTMPNFSGLAARGIEVEARLMNGYFREITLTAEINDDTVPLDFADTDRQIATLLRQQGEGLRVEVAWYFQQVDEFVSSWWGHLRPPSEGGGSVLKASAASGFRSTLLLTPRRLIHAGCAAAFGGLFATQAEIDEQKGCPYNYHIGGNVGLPDPATGLPYTSCPRNNRGVCQARLGTTRFYLSGETVIESIFNGQTRGAALYPSSKGNESNLKEPVRVIFGERTVKELRLYAYLKQFNNKHPEDGFVRCLFEVGEGTLSSVTECAINDALVKFEHLTVRTGELGQSPSAFTPNVSNYSGTAHWSGLYGQVNPAGYDQSNLRGKCKARGLKDLRLYTSATQFAEAYTTNRAWCLLEVERNPRWGRGKSVSRLVIDDWIDLAAWSDAQVRYRRADGSVQIGTRSTFNAELLGRPTQQQVSDICLFGRFGLPFRHNGKVRILPLRKESLADAPVFTDTGADRNIVSDARGETQLWYSYKSDAELPNELVVSFEDAAFEHVQRPLTFSDQIAQAKAAAALGDVSLHRVIKSYNALGITNEGEAIRVGQMLLNLGEFDGGGLLNNLTVRFITPLYETLNLHRYKLIRVESSRIEGFGFEYFRVMDRRKRGDLGVEIIAQAYPVDYYAQLEDFELLPPMTGGEPVFPNPGGRPGARPYPIGFDEFNPRGDRIDFQLSV